MIGLVIELPGDGIAISCRGDVRRSGGDVQVSCIEPPITAGGEGHIQVVGIIGDRHRAGIDCLTGEQGHCCGCPTNTQGGCSCRRSRRREGEDTDHHRKQ